MSLKGAAFANRFAGAPNYTPTVTLTTPTYDGSGITTEPTWIKKPAWVTAVGTDLLAHNPLTTSAVENPSILISNDNGTTWTTPPGVTNPIAAAPATGNYADCHLIADPNTNQLIMSWVRQAAAGNPNGVYYSICTDPTLVTWGAPVQLLQVSGAGNAAVGSMEQEPKIIWDTKRGKYLLYTQDNSVTPNIIRMRIAATSNPVGSYGAPTTCTVRDPDGQSGGPWHMDIIQEASGRFVMVFCDSYTPTTLQRRGWLASSWDGLVWQVAPRPFMKVNSWAVSGVYRPSIQAARSGSGYDLIVSRHQNPTAQLGLVRNMPASEIP